jgi:DNA-binding response OmpR family regulator
MRTVLIVEDDESVRELLRIVAGRCDSSVDVAKDGEEAIALLQSRRFDMVVLDLMLPKMNGFQVAQALRRLDPQPRLIVYSAMARYFEDRFWEGVTILQKPSGVPVMQAMLMEKTLGGASGST